MLNKLANDAGLTGLDAKPLSICELVATAKSKQAKRVAAGSPQTDESADQSARLIAAMGTTALQVSELADKKCNVEKRMRLIIELDSNYRGKKSEEWATLLNCTPQHIRALWKSYPDLRYEIRD